MNATRFGVLVERALSISSGRIDRIPSGWILASQLVRQVQSRAGAARILWRENNLNRPRAEHAPASPLSTLFPLQDTLFTPSPTPTSFFTVRLDRLLFLRVNKMQCLHLRVVGVRFRVRRVF